MAQNPVDTACAGCVLPDHHGGRPKVSGQDWINRERVVEAALLQSLNFCFWVLIEGRSIHSLEKPRSRSC